MFVNVKNSFVGLRKLFINKLNVEFNLVQSMISAGTLKLTELTSSIIFHDILIDIQIKKYFL